MLHGRTLDSFNIKKQILVMAKRTTETDDPAWKKQYPDHPESHEPDIHTSSEGNTIFHSCRVCDYVKTVTK